MKKVTGRKAYSEAVKSEMQHSKRGYGFRVMRVNTCPDCNGIASGCTTCGDEPDQPEKVIKVRGKWYQRN